LFTTKEDKFWRVLIQKNIFAYGEQIITEILLEFKEEINNKQVILLIENLFGKNLTLNHIKDLDSFVNDFDLSELKLYLFNEFWLTYQSKITELSVYGDGIIENLERSIILINTDRIWREHLQKNDIVKRSCWMARLRTKESII
jgi:preprotein translocase subunit SecA